MFKHILANTFRAGRKIHVLYTLSAIYIYIYIYTYSQVVGPGSTCRKCSQFKAYRCNLSWSCETDTQAKKISIPREIVVIRYFIIGNVSYLSHEYVKKIFDINYLSGVLELKNKFQNISKW